ncbi:NF-kappa-b inhibitor-like protein 2 [Plakobranchus ocellatus]|uniref:NF-kappa-b inhibitor-like protein 2 n=1 Tax=Plakobranchus ocellatus TaxID=259542 RepID=A0AAV4ADZ3_9GAST|nr:NF-kappa-b inhibitor-like protein 2 [Plakobranchus ocellatus]
MTEKLRNKVGEKEMFIQKAQILVSLGDYLAAKHALKKAHKIKVLSDIDDEKLVKLFRCGLFQKLFFEAFVLGIPHIDILCGIYVNKMQEAALDLETNTDERRIVELREILADGSAELGNFSEAVEHYLATKDPRADRIDPQTFGQSLDTERSTHRSAIGQSLDPERSTHHSASPAETSSSAADILKDFERLRDSLVRIPVPNNFKVNDTTTGIKQDCRGTLRVLSKCARFAETGLKVLTTLPDERDSSSVSIQREDLESIFVVFAAQINFLQSEYAGLVVKSTFNDETSRIFRSFENNASSFSRQFLQNVRIAAELASIHCRTNTASQSWRGRRRGVANQTRGSYSSFSLNRRRYDNNDMRSNTFTRPPTVREEEA